MLQHSVNMHELKTHNGLCFCTLFQYIDVLYVLKSQNDTTTIGSVKMKLPKSIHDINDNSTMSSSSVAHSTSILRHNGDININFNFDFKHWFQVVSSEYGYEFLANHLEYKFDLLTLLIDNKTQMRFDAEITKINQYFLIKQDNKLKQEHNQDNNVNYDRLSIQVSEAELPLSKSAIKLYHNKNVVIIIAFKSLYHKYVNGKSAPFMINISSTQRNLLIKLLNSHHFNKITLPVKATSPKNANSSNNDSMFTNDDLLFFLAIVSPVIRHIIAVTTNSIKQLSSLTASVQFACGIDYVSIT